MNLIISQSHTNRRYTNHPTPKPEFELIHAARLFTYLGREQCFLVQDPDQYHDWYGPPTTVFLSAVFTWDIPHAITIARYCSSRWNSHIVAGGPGAELPPHSLTEAGVEIWPWQRLANCPLDYSLLSPDFYYLWSSRGCIRACDFCKVHQVEGKLNSCLNAHQIKRQLGIQPRKILILDNNFLANPHAAAIMDYLHSLNWLIEFNQGLDARLISRQFSSLIAQLRVFPLRLSCDSASQRESTATAVELLRSAGVPARRFKVYMLFNFNEPPHVAVESADFLHRIGCQTFAMQYQPPLTHKDAYFAPGWSKLHCIAFRGWANIRAIWSKSGFWEFWENTHLFKTGSYAHRFEKSVRDNPP